MRTPKRLVMVVAAAAVAVFLVSGIALAVTIEGNENDNIIAGTADDDTLVGYGGDDTISGFAGSDNIQGGDSADDLYGGDADQASRGGADSVAGGAGNDLIVGASGPDELVGGADDDIIEDGPADDTAEDNLKGGAGDDDITAANYPASRDVVSCGDGNDSVTVDELDDMDGSCERVDRLLSEQQALKQDASEYAAAFGVSLDEARRRLELQDDVGVLGDRLETNEVSTFADLYIRHEPGFEVVALFTGQDGDQTIQPYLENTPLQGEVEVQGGMRATLAQLEAEQAEAVDFYEGHAIPFDSDINIQQNRAEIYVTDKPAATALAASSTNALPPSVAVVEVPALSEPDAFYAGLRMTPPNNLYCTSGFTVRHNDGREGATTAGHCLPKTKGNPNARGPMYYGGRSLPFQQQDLTGSHDVQWHTTPYEDRAWYRGNHGQIRGVKRTEGRRYQREGDYVCKYGVRTNFTCGKIVGRYYRASYVNNSNNTFLRVDRFDSRGNDRDMSRGGDSGGPVFYKGTAMGLVSGGIGPCRECPHRDMLYMGINYVHESFLGIRRIQTVN